MILYEEGFVYVDFFMVLLIYTFLIILSKIVVTKKKVNFGYTKLQMRSAVSVSATKDCSPQTNQKILCRYILVRIKQANQNIFRKNVSGPEAFVQKSMSTYGMNSLVYCCMHLSV